MDPVVARLLLRGRQKEKPDFMVTAEIGAPYEAGPNEWACPVSVRPLYDRLPDMHGVDSFQALFLAMRLAMALLKDFTEKGGSLALIDEKSPDDEFQFDDYRWIA